MRVAVGGIVHETNTFSPMETTLDNFAERWLLRRDDIVATFRGTNTPIGGFLEGAARHGIELVPTLFAEADPGRPAPAAVFDALVAELGDRIRLAGRLDGVVLDLHGAMVAEGNLDCETSILRAVRAAVGADVPIVAQLDLHANVSHDMVAAADLLVGREAYPEDDMAARGNECIDTLVRIVCEELVPKAALHQLSFVWGANQVTAHEPMRSAIAALHELERRPEVVCAWISTGFPFSDSPAMGSSVTVVTDNDTALAQELADELGAWIEARRDAWFAPRRTTADLLPGALTEGRFPVIFADWMDNTGLGAPGDSTAMLRTFLDAKLQDACLLYMVDPESVARCHAAGVGAVVRLEVGGKSAPEQGSPVPLEAEVVAVSDGRFRYAGTIYAGLEGSLGRSAHIRFGGVHVILVSVREQPLDTALACSLGLDPRAMRVIGVKSCVHFRAGFESWAGAIHVVHEPCVNNPLARPLSYQHLSRPVYPVFDGSNRPAAY